MGSIKTNVIGKVNNIDLKVEQSTMALHEAIVNSLQSIDDAQKRNPDLKGEVIIELRRDSLGRPIDGLLPVKDVVITDNGIGFTTNNYKSFQEAESTYKHKRGGKGIGRFLWLKIFNHADISSFYKDINDQKFYRRSFSFTLDDKNPIVDPRRVPVLNEEQQISGTRIKLCGLQPEYIGQFSVPLKELSDTIIEHHINFLVDASCPDIILREQSDEFSTTQYNLKSRFREEFLLDKDADSVEVANYTFQISFLHIKNEDGKARHSVLYSGNNRIVTTKSLSSLIPNLIRPLQREDGQLFDVFVIVSGNYLDLHVNRERTEFNIPDKILTKKTNGRPLLSIEEIQMAAIKSSRDHLDNYLVALREEKDEYIKTFVDTEAPQYKSLLKYTDRIERIKPGLSYDKLDIELHKLRNDISVETREGVGKLLSSSSALAPNTQEFADDLKKVMGMITSMSESDLADYVVQRKMILMLFERVLKLNSKNSYELEARIHNIVFPMKKSSDEVDYREHNLWLIDERLAYHRFLRSDKPLDALDKDSPKPDIVVASLLTRIQFENNLLYTDSQSTPYDSFTIIEFKRPMRDYYSGKEDDPIAQVQRYVNFINSGDATSNDGRGINPKNAKFYCYIVCDVTKEIREFANDRGFTETGDGEGYFWYNTNSKAYYEVISYDKLLKDSKQRNQILFDKLGIGKII